MSAAILSGLVVAVSLAAWVAFMAFVAIGERSSRARAVEREKALVAARAGAAPAIPGPEPRPRPRRMEEDIKDVTRRQFMNRAFLGSFVVGLANFSLASLDFLWPRLRGGFGAKITVNVPGVGDDADAIRTRLQQSRTPEFIADGRFYIAAFEGDPDEAAKVPAYKQANTVESGLVAIYRKCVHLGCSVPWCASAKWFECPCHGSKYSINGEYRDGPAPRSLDRFPVQVRGARVIVDTGTRIEMPRGVTTSQPQPEGEHCVEIAE